MNDIPFGEFICAYAGDVLTDQEANKDGTKYGDEYFVDLDLIEDCTETKEGYEKDVIIISSSSSGDSDESSHSCSDSESSQCYSERELQMDILGEISYYLFETPFSL